MNILLLVNTELLFEFLKLLFSHVKAKECAGLLEQLMLGLKRLDLSLLSLKLGLKELVLLVHLRQVPPALCASSVWLQHRTVLRNVVLILLLELVLKELLEVFVAVGLAEHRLRYRFGQLDQVLANLLPCAPLLVALLPL